MQDCTFTEQKEKVNIALVALMPSSVVVTPVIAVHRQNIHQNSNTVEDIFHSCQKEVFIQYLRNWCISRLFFPKFQARMLLSSALAVGVMATGY